MPSPIFTMFCCGVLTVTVVACSKQDDESKEALVKDPERLRSVLRACRDDPSRINDAHCRAASDAWRERFFQRNDADNTKPPSMHEADTSTPAPASSPAPKP